MTRKQPTGTPEAYSYDDPYAQAQDDDTKPLISSAMAWLLCILFLFAFWTGVVVLANVILEAL